MSDVDSPGVNLSPEAAIAAVAGPNRAWLAAFLVIAGGVAGAGLAAVSPSSWEGLRIWACAGYGVAVGGLLSLLPRFVALFSWERLLGRRPAVDDPTKPWWPLRLVASALRDAPVLRRTAEDFHTAVNAFVPQARGLLSQRLWPACVAAFTAPVLGLVSAWVSWRVHVPEAVRQAREMAQEAGLDQTEAKVDWGDVAWPMIITIALSLVIMMAIVLADQLTRRLLQRWASTVRPLDAQSPFVEERLAATAAGQVAARGERATRPTQPVAVRPAVEPAPPPEKPQPQVSAEELRGLGEMFRNG